jgi:hypothetical protein
MEADQTEGDGDDGGDHPPGLGAPDRNCAKTQAWPLIFFQFNGVKLSFNSFGCDIFEIPGAAEPQPSLLWF